MKIINQKHELLGCDDVKILMAILFIVLMIGVTPAFAAESHADQQSVTSAAVKANADINDASDVSDGDSGYINGYDDDGDYIGHYTVVGPSDSTSDEDSDYVDELGDQSDDADTAVVSSFGAPDISDDDYIGESDDMINSTGMDEGSGDEFDVIDANQIKDNDNDAVDEFDVSCDYNDEFDDECYIIGELDMSTQPDENNSFDQLPEDQFDEGGYYAGTDVIEYDDSCINQLNEDLDDVNELDGGNYTVVDSLDQSGDESTSQVDENVSATSKPLIVTIVNGLCGAVQATLEGLGNVCVVLGNELEAVL